MEIRGLLHKFPNEFHRRIVGIGFPYSRVVEVNPKTNKIEWEYKEENPFMFYSSIISGVQRLPNGNTLICDGTKGRIFKVNGEKEIVWEVMSPFYYFYRSEAFGFNNFVFRAYRYGPDYEGLKGRNLDPERFEWVLQERDKEVPRISKKEAAKRRLRQLGY